MAFQGYVSGHIDKDAFPIRHFVEQGIPVIANISLSKVLQFS